ncbi:hypothetical protein vseg_009094 [Gypsophila vaccaria]
MVPSGPPTPVGGVQSVTPSLLRSSSGVIRGQGGPIPSQGGYPSLNSPRTQFDNVNLLGSVPNVSLLNHSYGNGDVSPGIGNLGNGPRGGMDGGGNHNSNGMGFGPSTSGQGQQFSNSTGSHMLPNQSQSQQLESRNFQNHQQQLLQSSRGGLGGGGHVKLETQATGDQNGVSQHQGLGQVKVEPQQLQNGQGIGPVKMEAQHSGPSLFLQQQQQHQHQLMQQMSLSRPSSQAAQMSLLQQQRMIHLQQQQQQLLRSTPQQRSQLQPSQFSPQNLPVRPPVRSVYEPGMCARRLTHYMYQQQHRPEDNSIEFWRKFVAEYFAVNAKKKWCVSMYGSGRQTTGVFPQDVWHCEICKRKPGRGFEATAEVLPRLFKIKYESGTLEELLYVDMPREYQNSSGQIVLDYAKAIQESVFEQLRVVRDGKLRVVFSLDLKICSWEFCAQRHEELIPRRLLIPQVSQLGTAAQKYHSATQNSSSSMSVSDLQSNCNMFVASARQLAKTLEVPLVNDLGYTKRYVRCLQISEVVNSMKDLIDYSRLTKAGPMESLAKFPRRTSTSSALQGQNRQPEEQQQQRSMVQVSHNNDQGSTQAGAMQVFSANGVTSVNNSLNMSSSSPSHSTVSGLLHQNSMNSRQHNPMNNSNSPYGGASSVQNPSPFQSPTPSSSNNPATSNIQQAAMSGDGDTNDTQSSVQKFIQEMMLNNQSNGGGSIGMGSLRSEVKTNGVLSSGNSDVNVPNFIVGNGPTNSNSSMGGGAFGGISGGMGQASLVNGIRGAIGNNSMNGRIGVPPMGREQSMNHEHEFGDQMLSGLGAINGFNELQFDWKPSP